MGHGGRHAHGFLTLTDGFRPNCLIYVVFRNPAMSAVRLGGTFDLILLAERTWDKWTKGVAGPVGSARRMRNVKRQQFMNGDR